MPVINNNIPILDRKEWQMMTPSPLTATNGAFVISPVSGYRDNAMFVQSTGAQFLYSHSEDGWIQVPSAALAGTFGAGACGAHSPWSITYTASGGSTTTVTVAAATHNITGECRGDTIEFVSAGAATGQRRKITAIDNRGGAGTITLRLDYPVATDILNTHTFRITSGRFFVMCAGSTAAGSWKVFDVATRAWQANLSTTGFPASWGTDGKAVCTARVPNVLENGAATSGSSTTIVDTTKNWKTDEFKGFHVLIVDGAGEGQCGKITGNTSTTLTVVDQQTEAAFAVAVTNTSVYQIREDKVLACGVATSGSATTLVNSAKAWTANQWTNFQVRIVSGAGVGTTRLIASNTGTTLTIASGTAIDNTSVYEIEPCEDYIYVAGNNAVTMYRYSIAGNTWTTLAPTTARTGAPGTGMSLDFVADTNAALWAIENDNHEGRYLYSMRGAGGALIDRFDIAGGTAGAGAWQAVTYVGGENFTTGSSAFQFGRFLYIRHPGTNRFFKYDVPGNVMYAFNTDLYPDGTPGLGSRVWVRALDATDSVAWLYALGNGSTVLRRVGIV
jgi:hypothetical protein